MSKRLNDPEILKGQTKLTPEELVQFCQFQNDAFPPRGEITTFSSEVNQWLVGKHKAYAEKSMLTPDAWRDWLAYAAEKRRMYEAKADIEITTLPQADQDALREEWAHRYHGYFDYWPPNTKAKVDNLLRQYYSRYESEKAKVAAKAKELAEQRRLEALVAKLKAHKFPPLDLPQPDYEKLHAERKNPEKTKRRLLTRWRERFDRLPDHVSLAWKAYYMKGGGTLVEDAGAEEADSDDEATETGSSYYGAWVYLTPDPERQGIHDGDPDTIAAGLRDPSFEQFRRFSEGVRRAYNMLDDDLDALINPPDNAYRPLGLRTLDGKAYQAQTFQKTGGAVLLGVIPKGLTIVYGDPKHGKSAWLQKLAVCVADDRAKFEGLDIEHGPVAFITLDIGAEFGDFQDRALQIQERLGLPFSRDLAATDDQMYLNEPASVDDFLKRCPGQFKVIFVDPLYMAAVGSLKSDDVMMEVIKGLRTLARISDAVVLSHHEPRGEAHLYGSIFLEAAHNSKIHVVRTGDNVTVKVEQLKNDTAREKPFEYRLDGPFLADRRSTKRADAQPSAVAPVELHSQILACLPDNPTRAEDPRPLIDHLLPGSNSEARKKQWQRACKAMAKAGLINLRGEGRGTIIERRRPQ